jgi:hypothetical protein
VVCIAAGPTVWCTDVHVYQVHPGIYFEKPRRTPDPFDSKLLRAILPCASRSFGLTTFMRLTAPIASRLACLCLYLGLL